MRLIFWHLIFLGFFEADGVSGGVALRSPLLPPRSVEGGKPPAEAGPGELKTVALFTRNSEALRE